MSANTKNSKAVKSINNEAKAKLEAMAKQSNDRGLAAAVVLQEIKKAEETKGEAVTETKTKTKEKRKTAKDFPTYDAWCEYKITTMTARFEKSVAAIRRTMEQRKAKADPKVALKLKIAKLQEKLQALGA